MSAPNVLANRYASSQMRAIWGQENKIIAERRLWITIMEAQAELGVGFGGEDPATVIADYQAVVEDVSLDSIAEREAVLRHDVKARIEEFNALAGHEHVRSHGGPDDGDHRVLAGSGPDPVGEGAVERLGGNSEGRLRVLRLPGA